MLATYGVDVLDPRTTPRRLHMLLQRLPPDALRQGEAWSTEAELLAVLIDSVAQLTYLTVKIAGGKAQKPRPIPRPPARRRPAPAPGPAPANGKGGSWFDIAGQLATIPGVITDTSSFAPGVTDDG